MAGELGNYLLSFPVSPGQLDPAEEVPVDGAPLARFQSTCSRRRELKSSSNVSTKHTSEPSNTARLITSVLGLETGNSNGRWTGKLPAEFPSEPWAA